MFNYAVIASFVVGIFCLLFGSKRALLSSRSKHWPKVRGTVTRSRLREWNDGKLVNPGDPDRHKNWSWDFLFTFDVNGKTYKSNNASWKPQKNTRNKAYMESLQSEYPKNSEVVVYYESRNPKNNVLKPGFHWSVCIFPFLGLVFLVAAVFLYLQGN